MLNLFQKSTCEPSLVILGDILRCLLKLSGFFPVTEFLRGAWQQGRGSGQSPFAPI